MGTNDLPILNSILRGRTRGFVFCIGIGELNYEMFVHTKYKNWTWLRCRYHNAACKCTGTVRIKNIARVTPEDDAYANIHNWQILPNKSGKAHTCAGRSTRGLSEKARRKEKIDSQPKLSEASEKQKIKAKPKTDF